MRTRHAYLIMAHHEFGLLETLLQLLDDPRNDIYLHVDRRARGFDPARLHALLTSSNLYLAERMPVSWGGDSQIRCELRLLDMAAARGSYAYYHLLSGVDLPIKTQDEIHAFFLASDDRIYLGCNFHPAQALLEQRLAQYHPLQNLIGRGETRARAYLSLLDQLFCRLQRALGINRMARSGLSYVFGDNWFSIPQAFAEYVLQQLPLIRKCFYRTKNADELFLQTLAYNSPFREAIVPSCYRLIDWERGTPYTFRMDDLALLLDSDRLFARKFSQTTDSAVIEAIFRHLCKKPPRAVSAEDLVPVREDAPAQPAGGAPESGD